MAADEMRICAAHRQWAFLLGSVLGNLLGRGGFMAIATYLCPTHTTEPPPHR